MKSEKSVPMLTLAEVADRWRCSKKTVKRKGMPAFKRGRTPLYPLKVVERYELLNSTRPALFKEWTA